MSDTAQRLKELRERLSDLEWMLAGLPTEVSPTSRLAAKVTGLNQQAVAIKREITRLSEYEALGYDEPNF